MVWAILPEIWIIREELDGLSQISFSLEPTGKHEVLNPDVVDKISYIAREALTNSFTHSGASRIVVSLDYGKHQFRMTVADNGRGFEKRVLQELQANGHWGLRGGNNLRNELELNSPARETDHGQFLTR